MARVLGRAMRSPAAFDRKGTRWMLQLFAAPTVIVLVHRGRRSGKLYRTPLSVLAGDPEWGEIVVSPMWSRDADWYRNVIAGGLVEIRVRGEQRQVEWRELDGAEARAAGETFRAAHPVYSKIIVRSIVRLNRLGGDDPYEAVLQNLPMLGLRRAGSAG
jgi:deazaflavin-dependent oxidoreductase (nitroreductase family)